MSQRYAHPEYLVETDWVEQHLGDPNIRIIESDEDYLLYDTGHIPGAVRVGGSQLCSIPFEGIF
jgi:thiosulfate/3-mercaptopyruvate sulfurtransferase